MKIKIEKSKIISFLPQILTLLFLISFTVYAWTEPSSAPPGGNVPAPLNTGNIGQSKEGGLILNTGNATTGLIVDKGNVGIGTTNPQAKLDVNGSVKIGNFSSLPACGANTLGLLAYDTIKDQLFVCRTPGWKALLMGFDADGDGFMPGSDVGDDCYDANAQAFPGQTAWFMISRGDGSFDYNCNGSKDFAYPDFAYPPLCGDIELTREGWSYPTTDPLPDCGQSHGYIYLAPNQSCTQGVRVQGCH